MKKGRLKWIVIAVVIVAAVVAGSVLLGGGSKVQYAQETATIGSIKTYYNFSGSMDVDQSVSVTASVEDTVAEVYVKPNSQVAKNARLLRMSDGTIFKADIAGEVTALNVTVGGVARVGDMLVEIMDLSHMKATFKVDEYDVSAVSLGKMAQITLDGSGETFEGAITSINKRATQSGDLSYYTATVDLAGIAVPEDALPGMQITVDLLNREAENVVLLPMTAVSFTEKNAPYVLIQDGQTVKQLSIDVGMNDGYNVVITGGLSSGDTVLYEATTVDAFEKMIENRNKALSSGANNYDY